MRSSTRVFLFVAGGFVILLLAAQVVLNFLLKPILEREASRIFKVPIYFERASANLFDGSFWMKGVEAKNPRGFEETYFLEARTLSIDLSLLSLLTRELVVDQVLLKDSQVTVESNSQGQLNSAYFATRLLEQIERFIAKKPRLVYSMSRYTLEKFTLRNGIIQYIDRRDEKKNWVLTGISLSLARMFYPSDPEEALPAAVYLNATIPGAKEGKLLVLGRFNPFTAKKSFDITGSLKGFSVEYISNWMPNFPLLFSEGVFHMKVKAICHENQVDIYHHVRVEGLKFQAKQLINKKSPLVFGLPQETLVHFFNDLQPVQEPFEFDFRVTGDLSDPTFDIIAAFQRKLRESIYTRVSAQVKVIEEKAQAIISQ